MPAWVADLADARQGQYSHQDSKPPARAKTEVRSEALLHGAACARGRACSLRDRSCWWLPAVGPVRHETCESRSEVHSVG